ncbi:MAG: nitroreductase family protein [Candidatus Omnitrophica bacterium]|nr:nitroreductase family protein [Candidatus Omnitrophota bacterium]
MDLYELIVKRRSVRKFSQKKIGITTLKKIIDSGRLAPSAANLQFIEYVLINEDQILDEVFKYTNWAAYLPGYKPGKEEKPPCFIAVLINKDKSRIPDLRDVGAACQNIMLSAQSFGISSCWLGAIDKIEITKILKLPQNILLDSLIAIGYGIEYPRLINSDIDIKYWVDKTGQFFVPKRKLSSIIHLNRYVK